MAWQLDPKTAKRLTAAEGYIELGMPEKALEELETVDGSGPFEAARCYLTGEALKAQRKYAEAASYLQRAVSMVPLPQSRPVWLSLSECLRKAGKRELAQMAELNASLVAQIEQHVARPHTKNLPQFVLKVVIEPKSPQSRPQKKRHADHFSRKKARRSHRDS